MTCPALPTPARSPLPTSGTSARPCSAAVLPSATSTASAPAKNHFEAQSHGPRTRCLRFAARGLPPSHARLASGWWPPLPDGTRTRRVPREVSATSSTWLPPHPGFAWRTETRVRLALGIFAGVHSPKRKLLRDPATPRPSRSRHLTRSARGPYPPICAANPLLVKNVRISASCFSVCVFSSESSYVRPSQPYLLLPIL